MDKYQKYIFDKFCMEKNFIFTHCCPIEDEQNSNTKSYGIFDKKNDTFHIQQDENINKTKYVLIFDATVDEYAPFDGIFIYKNEKWTSVPCITKKYRILTDFNDRITAIKFVFANKLAADYILKITYKESDKEKYLAKVAKEKKEALEKAASIKVSTGADLVNIYFQPCCDKYESTEIQLYIPKEYVTVASASGPVPKPATWALIKKCKVPTDDFFESITGLAYGEYAFILKQYDKDNHVILETDYITFRIIKQEPAELQYVTVI